MIGHLEGKFTEKTPAYVIMDVNGVGYEVNISLNTYSAIQASDSGRLFTHLLIREDAHTLYGFFDREEKETFQSLISVSGVGATTARIMLSSLKAEEVKQAIISGNTKLIESVKGIGKKTAERLVLELRDKMGKSKTTSAVSPAGTWVQRKDEDAVQALVALGINRNQADAAVAKVTKSTSEDIKLEDLIKQALKAI